MYSKLIDASLDSPNCSSRNGKKIQLVTIHVVDGDLGLNTMLNMFAQPSFKASCNYCITSDGFIGGVVPEEKRSWCTSNRANDEMAVTIEMANDGGKSTGYHVADAAIEALVELLVDICKRNGIPRLIWKNDKTLIGKPAEQNMTVHRWFANKACPGDYLMGRMASIAKEVNTIMEDNKPSSWAKAAWDKAVTKHIFDGTNPTAALTREQLAVILERLGLI